MSTDQKFQELDALGDLFPFFRCPGCNSRKSRLSAYYQVTASVGIDRLDNPTKTFHAPLGAVGMAAHCTNVQIHCHDCETDFPLPEGWNLKID